MPPLPTHSSIAINLTPPQTIRLSLPHGPQLIDLWALSSTNPAEYLSMAHTRAMLRKLQFRRGDTLYSSLSRPMMEFVEDTTAERGEGGGHDGLIAACNEKRYIQIGGGEGGGEGHASCEDNYVKALERWEKEGEVDGNGEAGGKGKGRKGWPKTAPGPFNLFMNVKVDESGELVYGKPTAEVGDRVVFRALRECVVVISACPMDLRVTEEWTPEPVGVEWEVVG